MATTVECPKNIAREMLDKKRRVQEYVKSGDETKKPAGVKFVKPFTVPAEGH